MHRLFVAIRPPQPIRDLLIDAMDDSPDFRWQDDGQLHLTLRFVGEIDRPLGEDLAAGLGRIRAPRFSIRVKGVGRFEARRAGALWAGVEPKEPLAALAAKVERVCVGVGLDPERRTFHPHITLARWKGRRGHELMRFLRAPTHPRLRPVRGRRLHPVREPPRPQRRTLRGGCRLSPRLIELQFAQPSVSIGFPAGDEP